MTTCSLLYNFWKWLKYWEEERRVVSERQVQNINVGCVVCNDEITSFRGDIGYLRYTFEASLGGRGFSGDPPVAHDCQSWAACQGGEEGCGNSVKRWDRSLKSGWFDYGLTTTRHIPWTVRKYTSARTASRIRRLTRWKMPNGARRMGKRGEVDEDVTGRKGYLYQHLCTNCNDELFTCIPVPGS
jgi:hypothetical protein